MISRLLGYTFGIASVFGFSASFAVAAFPGWGSEKMDPANYRWRPVPVRSASVSPPSPSFRPAAHRKDPRRRLSPRYPRYYSSRFVRTAWRPLPAAGSYARYGAPDRRRSRYASPPSFGRPAVSPVYGLRSRHVSPRLSRYTVSPRMRAEGRNSQSQTVAGYRFRPLTEREKQRRIRRGDTTAGVSAFAFPGSDPRASLRFNPVPRRYAHASLPSGKPYLPVVFRPAAHFQDRTQSVARPLPYSLPPVSHAFRPRWSAPQRDGRPSRIGSPRSPGFRVPRQVYTAAPRWRTPNGFRSPAWKPRNTPLRHRVPSQGRDLTPGSHFASIPVPGSKS